ncbi:unnamed protein product [Lymnaea stagnalis]|uniref:Uncharacterized protein n=1 Tax=Lymnaea stagnalis TaxID=6523 RepID=A0AAV2HYD8_LYMST
MKSLSQAECSISPNFIGPDSCTVCLNQKDIGLEKLCQTCRSSPLIGWEGYTRSQFSASECNSPVEHSDLFPTSAGRLQRDDRSVSLVTTNNHRRMLLSDQASMTPREVVEHNEAAGLDEWLIFKDKVYSTRKLREMLLSLLSLSGDRLEADNQLPGGRLEADVQENKEIVNMNKNYCNIGDDFHDELTRLDYLDTKSVRLVLSKIILNRKTILGSHLSCCLIGYITQPPDARYWDDVRQDVCLVLNDLIRADAEDKISAYMSEYMRLLQRWMSNYRHANPKHLQWIGHDINNSPFPLPEEINGARPQLRDWLDWWVPFDTEIPAGGAWPVCDVSEFDLGDPHEIFVSSLKSCVDLTCLDMDIDGEVAWEVIQEGLFAADVLTPEQEMTEQQRSRRTDLCDPRRMAARREELLHYFVWKYQYEYDKFRPFLDWADAMAEGERRFLNMC